MRVKKLHRWDLSPEEAIELQNRLGGMIRTTKIPGPVRTVAGVDVGYSRTSRKVWAVVALFSFPELEILEYRWNTDVTPFPYIPGLLSFREIPVLVGAFEDLKREPDIILCDGQGIAHPRRIGLAAHLGLLLEKPTIGCAKSRLVGEYRGLGEAKGSRVPLLYRGETVGVVLRTRKGVKPLFVSPGHRITLDESVRFTLSCVKRYRLPEPTRLAHLLASRLRETFEKRPLLPKCIPAVEIFAFLELDQN
ncbi:MAG: deoxyribonuclease V [Deltaproteobacteria bacterium]|nr:deoxyribonuclease V [Deltaproteobacteria bacterium]